MAKQGIGTGTLPNDGTGDTLLDGAGKINDNFDEVYGVIGDGTTLYVGVVTEITAGSNVSVSAAYGSVEISATTATSVEPNTLLVSGFSTFSDNVKISSLTENRIPIIGAGSTIEDDANLTFDGTQLSIGTGLTVTGVSTFAGNIDANGDLDVDGHTELDDLNVSGVSTFAGNIDANGDLDVDGHTELDDLNVSGVSTLGVTSITGQVSLSGVIEKVSAATTYNSGDVLVLELDVTNSTTYRYSMPPAGNIGIVSFKNMPADIENGSTVSVLFTQNSTTPSGGIGNTQVSNGIGTNCTVAPLSQGSLLTGITTAALVGSASTVVLSSTANDVDFVSFFVHYNGGTNTDLTSYKVYATSNGNFRFGTVGI